MAGLGLGWLDWLSSVFCEDPLHIFWGTGS